MDIYFLIWINISRKEENVKLIGIVAGKNFRLTIHKNELRGEQSSCIRKKEVIRLNVAHQSFAFENEGINVLETKIRNNEHNCGKV